MKKTLLATAALVVATASPALAQSYDPDIGSGNLNVAPYAGQRNPAIRHHRAVRHRTVRRASPADAYARAPSAPSSGTPAFGYRWPGARYDANGYYIDPNSPGRW
jgi:hypothetical protein